LQWWRKGVFRLRMALYSLTAKLLELELLHGFF
jgi:hypothetical protein